MPDPGSEAPIAITCEVTAWNEAIADIPQLLANCLTSSARFVPEVASGQVSVLLTHDDRMRSLNRMYRGKDQATNVLSFPAATFPGSPLGDIALGIETCTQEAQSRDIPLADHLAHLFVHGILHLAGYDHDSAEDRQQMEQLESNILLQAGQADPWEEQNP
jgi:probable rRNA maturation factor